MSFVFKTFFIVFALFAYASTQAYARNSAIFSGQGLTQSWTGRESTFTMSLHNVETASPLNTCQESYEISLTSTTTGEDLALSCSCANAQAQCTFKPMHKGEYSLAVSQNGDIISQLSVSVGNEIYAPNCYAENITTTSDTPGIIGQNYYFTIHSVDVNGVPTPYCLSPSNTWNITLVGANTKYGSVINCTNGITNATYESDEEGGYVMSITYGDQIIRNSPFQLFFISDEISPSNMVAEGPGATSSIAGEIAYVTVQAVNQFGTTIRSCNHDLTWNAALVQNVASNPIRVPFNPNVSCSLDSGLYNLTYNATVAGPYKLDISIGDVGLQNNGNLVNIYPEPVPSALTSSAAGLGLTQATAGTPALVRITQSDRFGNLITNCDGSSGWKVVITVKQPINGKSQGCSGGVLSTVYTAVTSGQGQLSISYNNVQIQKGPFKVNVVAGPIAGPTTKVAGPGLTTAFAGLNSSVSIQAYDQYSNIIVSCLKANPFTVYLNTSEKATPILSTWTGCNQGNYSYVYNITNIKATYNLSLEYNKYPLDGSPFNYIDIQPGAPDARFCSFTGRGLISAVAGSNATFNAKCSDMFQNPISECYGPGVWNNALSLNGSVVLFAGVDTCTPGNTTLDQAVTYFSYNATTAGNYTLDIAVKTLSITQYKVAVTPGAPFPAGSYAQGPGVTSQSIVAGTITTFNVYTADRFHNRISVCNTSYSIDTEVVDPFNTDNIIYPSEGTCNGGVTPFTYNATVATNYNVVIKISGEPIYGSPYGVKVVSAEIYGPTIVAQGPGITSATAGENTTFTMTGYDRYNNSVDNCASSNTDKFTIKLTGPKKTEVFGSVTCEDGYFEGVYNATVAGWYNMTVAYNSLSIKNSPFVVDVGVAAISDSRSFAYGPGFRNNSNTTAGIQTTFIVQSADAFDNIITTCDTTPTSYRWILTIMDPKRANTTQTVSNCTNGAYTFFYTSKVSGIHTVSITGSASQIQLAFTNIQGSPSSFINLPAPFDPTHSLIVSPATDATAGEKFPINVQAKDQYDNNATCANTNDSLWNITADRFTSHYIGYEDGCDDGVYHFKLQVNNSGTYKVSVSYNGTQMKNSPISVTWAFGDVAAEFSRAVGDGVTPNVSTNIAGHNVTFNVSSYNQFGLAIPVCANNLSDWAVSFSPSISAYPNNTIVRNIGCTDGVTYFSYNATTAGAFKVNITFDGQPIFSSPYDVDIYPDVIDPENTIVTNMASANDSGSFYLIPRDRYYNNQTDLSKDNFLVALSPFCADANVTQTVEGDKIRCDYTVSVGGIYCVAVTYKGYSVNIKETTIYAVGGYACESHCNYQGYCFQDNVGASNGTATYSCNCFQGWVSDDCSVDFDKYPMQTGAIVGLVIGLSVLLFIIGLLIGWCVLGKMLGSKGSMSEDRSPLLSD